MGIATAIPVAAGVFLLAAGGCRQSPGTGVVYGKRTIRVGVKEITVEIAITPAQLEQGLKYRSTLPENRGMLFVYSQPARRPFWMRDTLIPLSIAFIDGEGKIINIREMEPDNGEQYHWPARPFLYALEMNRGWFAENNIRPGDPVDVGWGESQR